jgi:hypothetical protein
MWYAIYEDNRINLLAPHRVVPYLGAKMIIYGSFSYLSGAQRDELP